MADSSRKYLNKYSIASSKSSKKTVRVYFTGGYLRNTLIHFKILFSGIEREVCLYLVPAQRPCWFSLWLPTSQSNDRETSGWLSV